jgi:hypothetical protein
MPYTQQKFTADFEAAQQAGMAYHGVSKVLDSIKATEAWQLYENTRLAPLRMQIFGRHIFDQNLKVIEFAKSVTPGTSKQMPEFMVGITQTELDNFGKTNAAQSGSALLTGRNSWNLTINDVWVCGGAHGSQDFHPASPINARNIFSQQNILTITGRELVGLVLAGYVAVSGHASLGTVYRPSTNKNVEKLNLIDYQVTISALKTVEAAQSFFRSNGFLIAQ